MRLREFFQKNQISMKVFSEEWGFSYSYIRLISCGRRVPSLSMAIRITEATKGKVTPLDLLPDQRG
jgi:hypothetical protein